MPARRQEPRHVLRSSKSSYEECLFGRVLDEGSLEIFETWKSYVDLESWNMDELLTVLRAWANDTLWRIMRYDEERNSATIVGTMKFTSENIHKSQTPLYGKLCV